MSVASVPDNLHQYKYDSLPPLQPGVPFHLRIFALGPGTFGEGIRGRLTTYRNDQAPPYQAISYSWGSYVRDHAICFDDHSRLDITANLAAGLRRLRHEKEAIDLWIDAICINQADEAERGHQVLNMHRIYADAELVVVWLGEVSYRAPSVRHVSEPWQDVEQLALLAQTTADRVWWKRLWVVQEFLFPHRRPVIQLGARRLSIFQLHWEMETWIHHHSGPELEALISLHEIFVTRVQRDVSAFEAGSLEQRLMQTRGRMYTDPRDRIYALLSLVGPEVQSEFPPDYSLSVVQLFAEVTGYLLRERRRSLLSSHLNLLLMPWKPNTDPSWSLNFKSTHPDNPLAIDWMPFNNTDFWESMDEFEDPSQTSLDEAWKEEDSEMAGLAEMQKAGREKPLGERALQPRNMSIAVTGVILGIVAATFRLPSWKQTDVADRSGLKSVLLVIANRQRENRTKPNGEDSDRSSVLQLSIWEALSVICTARSHARSYHDESRKLPVSDLDRLKSLSQSIDATTPTVSAEKVEAFFDELDALDPSMLGALADHDILLTSAGMIGINRCPRNALQAQQLVHGTRRTMEGDLLVMMYGSCVPALLRRTVSGYLLLDACMVPALATPNMRKRKLEFCPFDASDCRLFRLV